MIRLNYWTRLGAGWFLGLLACGVSGCSSTPQFSATSSPPAQGPSIPYIIGPGDALSVFVYQAPQLSMEVVVRPDGRMSLPLVPDLVAAGRTPSDLAADVATRLKKYVNDPNVSVIVRTFVGPLDRQIRVIGEAADPQALPYRDHMTLLDVMIATKGLTRYAAGNSAVLVRQVGNERQTIKVRLSDLIKDGDIDKNVELQPGDTLIIPQSWF